jgi:predicted acylesterase/phospholipase RssA
VRGLAHIGVLQALEEQGIEVDLVVGTEWGALVGGLYAAGLTPDELQKAHGPVRARSARPLDGKSVR